MEFREFAERAGAIEAEPADLETVALVRDLFLAAGDDLSIVARFVQGRVFPAWQSRTLDVGPKLCYAAIARAAGPNVDVAAVEDRLADRGDVGDVAASYDFGGQRGLAAFGADTEDAGGGHLTVADVYAEFEAIADAAGSGSQDRKLDTLFGLFTRCRPEESRYVARLVLAEMRIGVGAGTVRDAIADAFAVPVQPVERALQVTNDYGYVAELAREDGVAGLESTELRLGRPVQAMLAQSGTAADALEDWGRSAVEWKFDGARVQVHYGGRSEDAADGTGRPVAVFSRNMEDVTDPLPDVVEAVEREVDPPAILDGEVVAVDDEGDPLPFQAVLRRFRRKHDVAKTREAVALEFHAFDCLHADGRDLLDVPLTERRERLEAVAGSVAADQWVTDDAAEVAEIEASAVAAGHEGVMLKDPESAYTPGRRGKHWLKVKPEVDTLDLVVVGAEWGEGRRANVFGTYVLGARVADDDRTEVGDIEGGDIVDGFAVVGKVATGVTEEDLAELTELLEPLVRRDEGVEVDLEPRVVFEVGYEEIQRSPNYESGFALRFPRYLGVRTDKDPADANTLDRIRRLADEQQ